MILEMVVCLVLSPRECRHERIHIATAETPMACLVQALPAVARWEDGHPLHRVDRWRCAPDDEGRT